MDRASGLLLPLSALPSPYGVGNMGKPALDFIDFLAEAGQSWWQLLPLGPTGFGDSPYQSFSTFAGNPYYIDPEDLYRQGLITRSELAALPRSTGPVDYAMLYETRPPLLAKACARGWERDAAAVESFLRVNAWAEDYALYMAIKAHNHMLPWAQWPDEALRRRDPQALARAKEEYQEEYRTQLYTQFLFFRQWSAVREHAAEKRVKLLGDLPFYVAPDAADTWAEPRFFQLDQDYRPRAVAGVPPDYFSEDGQLWGNPLYDWDAMAADGHGWWIRRLEGALRMYDAVRIDHFRAFDSYWSIPAGAKTAREGKWVDGPGLPLLRMLKNWFPGLTLVAEDLGDLRPSVTTLRQACGFPGMKVLQFAFDAPGVSSHQPHAYERESVCYLGTHDNDTALGWLRSAPPEVRERATAYLGLNSQEGLVEGLIRGAMSSVSQLCILRPQDLLGLGSEARINTPGTPMGNWTWRLQDAQLTPALAASLLELARRYGR